MILDTTQAIGWKANDFALQGIDGKTFSLAEVRGPKGRLAVFIANARRDLFEAMKQIADTGYGPKEATSIHGFDQMESLRCVWLSAFVGGAGRQLCVPKFHPFYLADQKIMGLS